MTWNRKWELLLLLLAASLLGGNVVTSTSEANGASISTSTSRAVLRWSSRYVAGFYFELEARGETSEWTGLLCSGQLIERPWDDGLSRLDGNFVTQGRLGPRRTRMLISELTHLEAVPEKKYSYAVCGPQEVLYFEIDGRSHQLYGPFHPKISSYLETAFFQEVRRSLERRWNRGEMPDSRLSHPAQNWTVRGLAP